MDVPVPASGSVTLSLTGAKLYGFTSGNGISLAGGIFAINESSQGVVNIVQAVANSSYTYDTSLNNKLTITNTKNAAGEIMLLIIAGTVSIDS